MLEIGLLKLGHVLCLVYWLGADVGVFYSSFFVADENLKPETRVAMAKLLFALDQGPRICMPLIFALGSHLAFRLGLWQIPGVAVAAIWLLCLAWLSMVIVLHARGAAARGLAAFDYGFRVAVVFGLAGYVAFGLLSGGLLTWVAIKLGVFAVLVLCGLLVRRGLRPFGPAFSAVAQGSAGAAENEAIRSSLNRIRPFVVIIWAGLLLNTALGVRLF